MKGSLRFVGTWRAPPHPQIRDFFPKFIASETELRVCVNRTCRRQGSNETLQILTGIAPPHVTVKSSGCLGRCGAGPNVVVLPDGILMGHCGTPARATDIMSHINGGQDRDAWTKSLDALALRKRAEDEMENKNVSQAQILLTQAINLKPLGGIHILHKDRSTAFLAMGNIDAAFKDAKAAISLAPKYPEAYICEGDVLMAMEQFDAAANAYSTALSLDPSIRRSKSFKARISKLEEKLLAGNLP